jgi:hypothetical protein
MAAICVFTTARTAALQYKCVGEHINVHEAGQFDQLAHAGQVKIELL